jgi:hypothetical protein
MIPPIPRLRELRSLMIPPIPRLRELRSLMIPPIPRFARRLILREGSKGNRRFHLREGSKGNRRFHLNENTLDGSNHSPFIIELPVMHMALQLSARRNHIFSTLVESKRGDSQIIC